MNARYVGLTPYAAWYSCLSSSRAATIRDMSTSIALVTCAAVSSERRMCSAMPRRIAVTGSRLSPSAACGCGLGPAAAGGGGEGACGAGGGAIGGAGAGSSTFAVGADTGCATKARISCFVTRPPRPVPAICAGSTPCSAAMRATTGETNARPPLPDGCCALRARAPGGASDHGDGLGLGAGSGAGSGAGAGSAALPPICASFVPTGTVSPSLDEDLRERAGGRARHLGVDLVGRDLQQRLVGLDRVAFLA